jgi:hypothetical protein
MVNEAMLVSVLREGVTVIQMVLFKTLKHHLAARYPDRPPGEVSMLSGAIVNALFGIPASEPGVGGFAQENESVIQTELEKLAENFDGLKIPLTDALRVQFLCDSLDGIDSRDVLLRARELDILLPDRDVPLPRNFMNLVRRLGAAHRLIVPPPEAEPTEGPSGEV